MPKQALVVNTKAEVSIIDIAEDSLRKLQSAVDGLIQPVDIDSHVTMWVNEEGLFRNDLEMNPIGSGIYSELFGVEHPIIGDIVFTGGTDEEGNTLGIPQDYLEALQELASDYRVALSVFDF